MQFNAGPDSTFISGRVVLDSAAEPIPFQTTGSDVLPHGVSLATAQEPKVFQRSIPE
ncbi:MAG TPA: hypothetical protein VKW06_00675 [Candidatus Angelobacter sp.]|nr:hypothetical protein [Candidatus Angelobacter sp.]